MPSQLLNSSFIEDILFVTVRSPQGFIIRENETGYYLNATLQILYFDVLFRKLILTVDCYTMMNGQEKNSTFCS